MSTSSVSSPKKRGNKQNPAKWDEEKTRVLLEVFEHEIDIGNRPSGVFSREGWSNIVHNFNDRTGLKYNKDQLKNRQDNLRREFSKWEKLVGRETGLGWDYDKQTLSAPDAWWEERAKSDPTILKWRESGPANLELLQKVFCGITATGFYSYVPEESFDPLLNSGDRLENMTENINAANVPNTVASDEEANIAQTPRSSNLRGPKRKRLSSGSHMSAGDKIHSSMESLSSAIREGIDRFNPKPVEDDEALSYKEVLVLLKGLPGMQGTNPLYLKAVRILTDKLNRIAFVHLLEDGIDSVLAWIESF